MIARLRARRGQSTVEVVAITPLVALCGLLALQALIAGANYVVAGNAAHAGALAGQLGRSAAPAARRAAPGWVTSRVAVMIHRRRVHVRLRPRAVIPPLAPLLSAEAEARYTGR